MKWVWPAGLAASSTALFAVAVPLAYALEFKPPPGSWADVGLAAVIWMYLGVTPLAAALALWLGAHRERSGRWLVPLLGVWLVVVVLLGFVNLR